MADYTVVWSGSMKQSLPGLGGIQRRACYLTEGAMRRTGDLPSAREMVGKTDLTGLQIRQAPTQPCAICVGLGRRCRRCAARLLHRARKNDRPRCACGGVIGRNDWSAGVRRCQRCIEAGAGRQVDGKA